LKRKHRGYGDTYFLDEVFVKIRGKQHYLWRAIDQDGEVVDVYLQERRDGNAAKRFFKRFLEAGGTPREIVTDKLRSYRVNPWDSTQHRTICQQSSRAFSSTNPGSRAGDATIQID
jgi:transposase-like protein